MLSNFLVVLCSSRRGDGCVGNRHPRRIQWSTCTMKKRRTFFTLFNAISISKCFCSCQKRASATQRFEIYEKFKRSMALKCAGAVASEKLCIHILCCWSSWRAWRVDRQTNDRFGCLSWLAACTMSIAARSCVNGDEVIENVRIFLPFISICAFVYLLGLGFRRQPIRLSAMHQTSDKRVAKSAE